MCTGTPLLRWDPAYTGISAGPGYSQPTLLKAVPNRQAWRMGRLACTTTVCKVSFVAEVHSGCGLLEGVVPLPWALRVLKCCQGCFSERCGSGTQLLCAPGKGLCLCLACLVAQLKS